MKWVDSFVPEWDRRDALKEFLDKLEAVAAACGLPVPPRSSTPFLVTREDLARSVPMTVTPE